MNIFNKLIVCAAVVVIFGSVNAYAYSGGVFQELDTEPADGFYTVITDTEGEKHTLDGILDTQRLEKSPAADKIASYTVCSGEQKLINVKLNGIIPEGSGILSAEGLPLINGYYSVRFPLSETDNTEVFLTGLSDSNLDTVQERLLAARHEHSDFTMESLDFIDAEKTDMPNDGDNELCWAAGASNVIHYTGWGQKAGFRTTDDILDLFRDSFTDLPSNSIYGIEWFFNGTYVPQTFDDWAHVKNYGESGAFLKQYESGCVMNYWFTENEPENMKQVTDALEGGSGVVLSIGWVDENANRMGGHSITMWGYICDRNFSAQDKEYYKAVIISNSDSDMVTDENRRMAPNKLNVLNLHPYSLGQYDTWQFDDYDAGIIEMAVMLEPYSDETDFETDGRASLDKFNDVDLTVRKIYLSTDSADNHFLLNACSENESLYVVPKFYNTAATDFYGAVDYTVTVTDKKDGSEKRRISNIYNGAVHAYDSSDISNTKTTEIAALPAGEYTVTVEVNPEKSEAEAYYYNNTTTYDFTVSEKSYDLSQVDFSARAGEFVNGESEVELSLSGYDTIDIPQDVQVELLVSYYEDGMWSAWSIADTADTVSAGNRSVSVPENCTIYARGQKARFRLAFEPADPTEPLLNIYSNEIDLNYVKIGLAADETNTGTYTRLDRAARSLSDGERIAFNLTNASTYDCGEITCRAAVYAVKDDEKVELFSVDGVSLVYGAEPITFGFSEWSADNLSGTYELTAVTECEYGSSELVLGSLYVKERLSLVVTTGQDITDAYDGIVSLREAVSYAKEMGKGEITFADGVNMIFTKSPIIIDCDIKLKGCYSEYINTYTLIYALNTTQLFYVTENGVLDGEKLNLNSGYSETYGGAVENCGGTVRLNNCLILYNKSGIAGGAIYSKGGSVKLSGCALKGNKSGYGGAIGTDGNAKIAVLNCSFFLNTSNSGALYNNGGEAVILYSTFTDNTASSSGGGAITSAYGKVSVFGSIAVNNGECDIDGAVNVYGSYITAASEKTVLDERTVKGDGSRLFEYGLNGFVAWRWAIDREQSIISYKVNASELIKNGIYLKNSNGTIAYSADGSEWIVTDTPAAFTDDEYQADLFGTERAGALGSVTEVCSEARILEISGGKAYIFVPRAGRTVLIEKSENADRVMTGVKLYEAVLEPGTNTVGLESAVSDSDIQTYMLWDSMENLRPIADAFVTP